MVARPPSNLTGEAVVRQRLLSHNRKLLSHSHHLQAAGPQLLKN
jgi:hypothetical protein